MLQYRELVGGGEVPLESARNYLICGACQKHNRRSRLPLRQGLGEIRSGLHFPRHTSGVHVASRDKSGPPA